MRNPEETQQAVYSLISEWNLGLQMPKLNCQSNSLLSVGLITNNKYGFKFQITLKPYPA